MTDPLARFQLAQYRAAFEEAARPETASAGTVVDGQPCDECPDEPETLQSPALTVVPDEPVSAAATSVRDAIVWPADHFAKWTSRKYEPLTVHPDGRITGHLAGSGCFRNGDTRACIPYRPDADPTLKNFNTWTTTLDNGEVVRTGAITADGPHAPITAAHGASQIKTPAEVARYHEDTSTVFARVVAWEDERGRLAVSGSILPDLDPAFVRRAAGAPVSIEKIPTVETGMRNTLVGAHMVVSPALPVITA